MCKCRARRMRWSDLSTACSRRGSTASIHGGVDGCCRRRSRPLDPDAVLPPPSMEAYLGHPCPRLRSKDETISRDPVFSASLLLFLLLRSGRRCRRRMRGSGYALRSAGQLRWSRRSCGVVATQREATRNQSHWTPACAGVTRGRRKVITRHGCRATKARVTHSEGSLGPDPADPAPYSSKGQLDHCKFAEGTNRTTCYPLGLRLIQPATAKEPTHEFIPPTCARNRRQR
jgi:hypothetical protein